jgi:hypothetical protein
VIQQAGSSDCVITGIASFGSGRASEYRCANF